MDVIKEALTLTFDVNKFPFSNVFRATRLLKDTFYSLKCLSIRQISVYPHLCTLCMNLLGLFWGFFLVWCHFPPLSSWLNILFGMKRYPFGLACMELGHCCWPWQQDHSVRVPLGKSLNFKFLLKASPSACRADV